jgi:hypothetical protein
MYMFMKELDSVEGSPAEGEGNICIYKYIFLHIYMYICYMHHLKIMIIEYYLLDDRIRYMKELDSVEGKGHLLRVVLIKFLHLYMYIYICIFVYMDICVYKCIYIYVYLYASIYMFIYMYIYVYMYEGIG